MIKKTKPSEQTQPTEIEKAQAVLRAELEKKTQACAEEINQVLEKYGLMIEPRATVHLVPKQ